MVAGVDVPIVWNGRRASAFVPARLADRDLALDVPTATRTGEAVAEVLRAAEALELDYEPLARLLLRSEGVASSYIEGITAPVLDVVLAEDGRAHPAADAAAWVAAALAAMVAAVDEASHGRRRARRRHPLPLAPTPDDRKPDAGALRRSHPRRAGLDRGHQPVRRPPGHPARRPPRAAPRRPPHLGRTGSTSTPCAQAAIAHAQFEIIHPFADGNGRIGRVLIAWLLVRRLSLLVPPPVSVAIAADVGGYGAGLVRFRRDDHLGWVRWFADAVIGGGRAQRELVAQVEQLRRAWYERLAASGRRRDAVAYRALTLLPRHLLLTSTVLVDELQVSTEGGPRRAARPSPTSVSSPSRGRCPPRRAASPPASTPRANCSVSPARTRCARRADRC